MRDHGDDFPEEFIFYKEKCDRLTIEDLYRFNLARTDVLDNFENIFAIFNDNNDAPAFCAS